MSEVQRGGRFRHFAESLSEASREYRMLEQAPAMYELLKDIEFVEDGVTTWCPCCGENPPGHSSDCRLAALLKAVEGE